MTDIAASFGILRLPDSIVFGDGARASIPAAVGRLGRRALVVCDPFLASTAFFAELLEGLAGLGVEATVESGVVPELPVGEVEAAIERAREAAPEVVVGLGGGSALDLAKLVAVGLAHGTPLNRFYGENVVPGPVLPLVAVPTTSGTGSEVTPVAVLADPDRELKVGISSPYLIPRAAIVDPRLTVGAPPSVTASSGADALVHAIEAYTAQRRQPEWGSQLPVFVGSNLLSSALALEAIGLIGRSLRRAVADGSDFQARAEMSYASLLAGMAFGTAGTHLSHAIQYPVGALTHTPHGLGTGMLLPYVLRAILPTDAGRLAEIAGALGVARTTAEESAEAAIDEITAIMGDIGLPHNLASMGVNAEDLDRIVELSLTVQRLVAIRTSNPPPRTCRGSCTPRTPASTVNWPPLPRLLPTKANHERELHLRPVHRRPLDPGCDR